MTAYDIHACFVRSAGGRPEGEGQLAERGWQVGIWRETAGKRQLHRDDLTTGALCRLLSTHDFHSAARVRVLLLRGRKELFPGRSQPLVQQAVSRAAGLRTRVCMRPRLPLSTHCSLSQAAAYPCALRTPALSGPPATSPAP